MSYDYSDPNNWDEGAVPSDGDDIVNIVGPMYINEHIELNSITVQNPDNLYQFLHIVNKIL